MFTKNISDQIISDQYIVSKYIFFHLIVFTNVQRRIRRPMLRRIPWSLAPLAGRGRAARQNQWPLAPLAGRGRAAWSIFDQFQINYLIAFFISISKSIQDSDLLIDSLSDLFLFIYLLITILWSITIHFKYFIHLLQSSLQSLQMILYSHCKWFSAARSARWARPQGPQPLQVCFARRRINDRSLIRSALGSFIPYTILISPYHPPSNSSRCSHNDPITLHYKLQNRHTVYHNVPTIHQTKYILLLLTPLWTIPIHHIIPPSTRPSQRSPRLTPYTQRSTLRNYSLLYSIKLIIRIHIPLSPKDPALFHHSYHDTSYNHNIILW
jgi:hypothetical protein